MGFPRPQPGYGRLDGLTMLNRDNERYIYQYDAFNRRVSKLYERKNDDWQGVWERHYLYIGQKEIGVVKENGKILELRILGSGKGAEIGAAVALELYGKTYVPIHDQSGNIALLIDRGTGKLAEAYAYTAFGEKQIYNEEILNRSSVGNPWHFSSKRLDPESGWIYFGRRYYDPATGRWTTPDPVGFQDGPNLYAYVKNNPLTHFDEYGLYEVGGRSLYDLNGSSRRSSGGFTTRDNAGSRREASSSSGAASRKAQNANWHTVGCCKQKQEQGTVIDGAKTAAFDPTLAAIETGCRILYPSACNYDERSVGVVAGYLVAGWTLIRSAPAAGWFILRETVRAWRGSSRVSSPGISTRTVVEVETPPGVSIKEAAPTCTKTGRHRNHFEPDSKATGAHSVWRQDPALGDKLTHYETFQPQTNPRNPNPWESVKRFDGVGVRKGHHNKALNERIPEPHVHDPKCPGGIRKPELWEFPKGYDGVP